MKTRIKDIIALIRSDRTLLGLLSAITFIAVGYCLYIGLSIHARDIQVAIQYTAFGPTNVYREQWYYLITLIVFGIAIAVIHSILMVKLLHLGRRQSAIFLGCVTILLQVLTIIYSGSILAMAAL
jgi:hypothetical protein